MTTIGIEELDALEKRVQEATGPDRELDARLHVALFPTERGMTFPGSQTAFHGTHGPIAEMDWRAWEQRDEHRGRPSSVADHHQWPAYTAALGAALALVERVLPGWRVVLDSDHDRDPPWGAMVRTRGRGWPPRSFSPTPPLALLSALIAALRAKAGA